MKLKCKVCNRPVGLANTYRICQRTLKCRRAHKKAFVAGVKDETAAIWNSYVHDYAGQISAYFAAARSRNRALRKNTPEERKSRRDQYNATYWSKNRDAINAQRVAKAGTTRAAQVS